MNELKQAVDSVLLGNMPDSFRAATDNLLAKGQSKKQVLRYVQSKAGKKSLTYCQVAAYLDTKGD